MQPRPKVAGTRSSKTSKPKPPKMTPAEQSRRFEEMARELGCDDGQALDAAFDKIVPPKVSSQGPGGQLSPKEPNPK